MAGEESGSRNLRVCSMGRDPESKSEDFVFTLGPCLPDLKFYAPFLTPPGSSLNGELGLLASSPQRTCQRKNESQRGQ